MENKNLSNFRLFLLKITLNFKLILSYYFSLILHQIIVNSLLTINAINDV